MLESLRALDLTGPGGLLCGRILADLGCDVIKIEKPGGDPARRACAPDDEGMKTSTGLFWLAYNANKRGITLDIENHEGRDILKKLLATADILIESFAPGYLASLGLGYPDLRLTNPRIIMASVTPFGQSGPYSRFKGCDMVSMAMGGMMYLTGDPDRVPVCPGVPLAYLQASTHAAAAVLAAHFHRMNTGRGQHVDVSMQASVPEMTLQAIPTWVMNHVNFKRSGQARLGFAQVPLQSLYPCKDGFVAFMLGGGALRAGARAALAKWMESEGVRDFPKPPGWPSFDIRKTDGATLLRMEKALGDFFLLRTKAQLYEEGVNRGIDIYPVSSCRDIVESLQLKDRNFFVTLRDPGTGADVAFPGPFIRSSESNPRIRRWAPGVGEHNEEIYAGELGLSRDELLTLRQRGVI